MKFKLHSIIYYIAIITLTFCYTAQAKGQTNTSNNIKTARMEYTKFHSASLKQDVTCAISLPPSYDREKGRRYPVVIFLHGLFNSEQDWENRGIQAQLDHLRASGKVGEYIIAIPYGSDSFYLNSKNGARYEDAIVQDFIPFVDRNYRTLATPAHRLIEGISMGGYGALMIAFKHPEMFAGVAAHCAALFHELPKPGNDPRSRFRYELSSRLFGKPYDQAFFQANNPVYLAKTNANKIKQLKIYFDIGKSDRYGFEIGNQELDNVLTAAGIKHEFYFTPGEHGWSYLVDRSEPAFIFCWQTIKN